MKVVEINYIILNGTKNNLKYVITKNMSAHEIRIVGGG